MKKILVLAMSMVLSFSVLAGCTNNSNDSSAAGQDSSSEVLAEGVLSNEEATLSIYAQYSDDDTKIPYDYAVEQLKKAYPNVTLKLEVQAQDDGQKLMTYAATGNLPDIYQVALSQIENFKESGNIMVLNDIAKETGFTDKVFESAENILYNEDGNIYAFPYAGNEYVVWYYNKAIFDEYNVEVPTTFDELIAAAETFNDNDIVPMSIFGTEGWITAAMYDVLATRWDAGGIAKLDNGEGTASEDAYKNAAEMMNKLVNAGLFQSSASTTNYDQASQMFLNGEAAMFLNGQWYMTDATATLGDDVDWMYYPSYDKAAYEEGKTAWSGGGAAAGYAVNPKSENAELAAKVAAFISEKYCEAKVMYRGTPLVAVNVDVEPENEFPAMMKKLQADLPSITSITKFDWHLTNPTFKTAIEDQTKYLLVADYSPDDFIAEVNNSLK